MPTYRKRPVEIEAREITPETIDAVAAWCSGRVKWGADDDNPGIVIPTLEGDMFAALGDQVIKGVVGEFYPCKPAIFAATYESAEDRA